MKRFFNIIITIFFISYSYNLFASNLPDIELNLDALYIKDANKEYKKKDNEKITKKNILVEHHKNDKKGQLQKQITKKIIKKETKYEVRESNPLNKNIPQKTEVTKKTNINEQKKSQIIPNNSPKSVNNNLSAQKDLNKLQTPNLKNNGALEKASDQKTINNTQIPAAVSLEKNAPKLPDAPNLPQNNLDNLPSDKPVSDKKAPEINLNLPDNLPKASDVNPQITQSPQAQPESKANEKLLPNDISTAPSNNSSPINEVKPEDIQKKGVFNSIKNMFGKNDKSVQNQPQDINEIKPSHLPPLKLPEDKSPTVPMPLIIDDKKSDNNDLTPTVTVIKPKNNADIKTSEDNTPSISKAPNILPAPTPIPVSITPKGDDSLQKSPEKTDNQNQKMQMSVKNLENTTIELPKKNDIIDKSDSTNNAEKTVILPAPIDNNYGKISPPNIPEKNQEATKSGSINQNNLLQNDKSSLNNINDSNKIASLPANLPPLPEINSGKNAQNQDSDKLSDTKNIINNATNFIIFDQNSVTIAPSSENLLNSILQDIKNSGKKYKLVGYSTASSNEGDDRRIALQRVVAIRKFLIDNGVNSENLAYQAIGNAKDRMKEEVSAGDSVAINIIE